MGDITRNIAISLLVRSFENTHSEPTFRCSTVPPFPQFHSIQCRLTSHKLLGIVRTFFRWVFVLDHRVLGLNPRLWLLVQIIFIIIDSILVEQQPFLRTISGSNCKNIRTWSLRTKTRCYYFNCSLKEFQRKSTWNGNLALKPDVEASNTLLFPQ